MGGIPESKKETAHLVLFTQIKAWWIRFIWYNKDFEVEVTDKGKLK